ncbi:MAG: hypothetical protein LCH84_09310 [Gemmatimonadetes bacterium]|nr:hypothetical protein [Gemmatimonadota bacterium]
MSSTRLRWQEMLPFLLALIGVGLLAWHHASFETRVERQVQRARAHAADYWTGMVQAGVSPDSATPVALRQLRERLAGTAARTSYPFVARTEIDSLWQAVYLNPFLPRAVHTPRTDAELSAVRASEVDVRLALAAGAPLVRAREVQRLRRLDALVGLGVACLVMWSAWQRRARRRRERVLEELRGAGR